MAAVCEIAHAAGVRVAVDNTVATPVLTRPFEAWLLQRGMRTLFLRVHRASETALAIAGHFAGHPAMAAVLYPGAAPAASASVLWERRRGPGLVVYLCVAGRTAGFGGRGEPGRLRLRGP
jgi:cystathionine beta-lyase/cystathionine gamma-synthase